MASSNPPHSSSSKFCQPTTLAMLQGIRAKTYSLPPRGAATGVRTLAMSLLAPAPKAYSASSTLGTRLVNYLPDSIHMVALSELASQFVPNVPASFVPSATAVAPAFGIASGVGGAFTYPVLPATPPCVDAEVRALRGTLSAAFVTEGREQIEWPSLWLAVSLNLQESVQNGLGLATCFAMDTALIQASQLNMHLKEMLGVPRPNDPGWTAPVAAPLLTMPCNRSFPAGHAMALTTVVTLMQALLGPKAAVCAPQLQEVANFLIDNRRDTGMHTQLDNEVGIQVGQWLGQQLLAAELLPARFPYWAALCELARSEWA